MKKFVFGSSCGVCSKPGFVGDVTVHAHAVHQNSLTVIPTGDTLAIHAAEALKHLQIDVRQTFFCDRTKGCEQAGPWTVTEPAVQVPPSHSVLERQ